MARKTKASPLAEAILETAEDMRRLGIMSDAGYAKITLRHLEGEDNPASAPLTPTDIRVIRERSRMSQAVFAQYLNVSTGYVSQLERGVKQPTGAALALLNLIRRKGIEAIL